MKSLLTNLNPKGNILVVHQAGSLEASFLSHFAFLHPNPKGGETKLQTQICW